MVDTGRTYWSKDPDEAPPYSDWEITFAKKNGDDETRNIDWEDGDDDNRAESRRTSRSSKKTTPATKKKKKHRTHNSPADVDTRSSNRTTAIVTTYHVHRNMVGPRSEYFNRIFDASFFRITQSP